VTTLRVAAPTVRLFCLSVHGGKRLWLFLSAALVVRRLARTVRCSILVLNLPLEALSLPSRPVAKCLIDGGVAQKRWDGCSD
jgi:hypothetical protein